MNATRPELSYDGKGINGPDEYRARIATFDNAQAAKHYGPMFAAAPELVAACEGMLEWARRVKQINPGPEIVDAMNALAKAKGVDR